MPASRPRKKKHHGSGSKPSRSGNPATRRAENQAAAAAAEHRALSPWREGPHPLVEYRQELDRQRMARASVDAELIVTELSAAEGTGPVIEDRLCLLLGKTLTEQDAAQHARRASGEEEILDSYSPDRLLDAVTDKALLKVSELVGGDDADAATRALRLSAAIARVTPYPSAEIPTRAMAQLTNPTSTDPNINTDRTPAGPALWCRDGYGTRLAIIAPFESAGRVDCWYLWDIDVCGSDAYTVASGFHPSPDHALTAWRKTVGPTATEASHLEPVTNPQLAASLLPGLPDFLHPGGEDEAQYAEYHRSRRLAQELRSSDHLDGSLESAGDASPDDAVEKSAWIAEFTAWRSKHRPESSTVPDGLPPIEDNEPLTDAVSRRLRGTRRHLVYRRLSRVCILLLAPPLRAMGVSRPQDLHR